MVLAGPQYPDKEDAWTAKLVLESEPRWLKSFFLRDQVPKQVELLKKLKADQPAKPKRHIGIWQGQFQFASARNVGVPAGWEG